MKTALLPLLLATLFLAGCATLSEPDRDVLRQHRVSPALYAKMNHREELSLTDIMELADHRVPGPFVIHYLRSTYAVYRLTAADVVILRRAGVPRPVIDYLLSTPALYAPRYDPWGYGYGYPWWYGGDFYGWGGYGWGGPDIFIGGGGDHHHHH